MLNRQAVMFLQNMAMMSYKQIVTALPVCRLPYKSMWVEMAFRDRADWLAVAREHGVAVSENDFSSEPKRLGFLLEEAPAPLGDDFIMVQLAWCHTEPAIDISRKAILIDMRADRFDDERYQNWRAEAANAIKNHGCTSVEDAVNFFELSERIAYIVPPHCERLWDDIAEMGATKQFEEMTRFDLASEWRFILTLLIALNSRNLLKTGDAESFDKLNKAPLLDYRTINLSLSPAMKRRMGSGYYDPLARKKSDPHWVCGHFKVRRGGIFFWSSHERGGRGAKHKLTKVTA